MVVVCALTPVFNVLTSEPSVRAALQGLVDAPLITLLVGGYLDPRRFLTSFTDAHLAYALPYFAVVAV